MGLFAQQRAFRQRNLSFVYFHNEAFEERSAKVGYGTPYETLLGVLCSGGDDRAKKAAKLYRELADEDLSAIVGYLRGFIETMFYQLDTTSIELNVKSENRHTPMDFPRPSPTRLMIWTFAKELSRNKKLYEGLASAAGADWFFSLLKL